ncbi:MAG: hypothetical protein KGN78_13970 [Actinomycetales bacterium]|nr:hypothetical protein [Actinomycetales bacterium]
MAAHEAWSLVCRLFSGGSPVLRAALSPAEVSASALLGAAIKPTVVNRSFALCPYCQLRNGQIFADDKGGQFCLCSDCGRIALAPDDRAAVTLDENWLRSRLRMAMDIESRDGVTDLVDGVWRLGDARREPVLLSRSLARVWAEPAIFERVRVSGAGIRVIAPRSPQTRGRRFHPVSSGCRWKSDSRSMGGGSRTSPGRMRSLQRSRPPPIPPLPSTGRSLPTLDGSRSRGGRMG